MIWILSLAISRDSTNVSFSEIQIDALKNHKWHNVKPQVDEVEFPDGKKISILLTIAFLITLNLENSIQFIENYSDKLFRQ